MEHKHTKTTDYMITSTANGQARLEIALVVRNTGEQTIQILIRQADGQTGRIQITEPDLVDALMEEMLDLGRKSRALKNLFSGCR